MYARSGECSDVFYTFSEGEESSDWGEFENTEYEFDLKTRTGNALIHRTKNSGDSEIVARIEFDGKDRFNPHLTLQSGFVTPCENTENQTDEQFSVVEYIKTLASKTDTLKDADLTKLHNRTHTLTPDQEYSVGTEIAKNAIANLDKENNFWIAALGQMESPWKSNNADNDIASLFAAHLASASNPKKKQVIEKAINNHFGMRESCKAHPLEKVNDGQNKHGCFERYLKRYATNFDRDEIFEVRLMSAASLLQEVIVGKDPSGINLLKDVVSVAEELVNDITAYEEQEKETSGPVFTHSLHSDSRLLLAFAYTLMDYHESASALLADTRVSYDPVVNFELLANGSPDFVQRKLTSSIVVSIVKTFSAEYSSDMKDIIIDESRAIVDDGRYLTLKSELGVIENTGYGVKLGEKKLVVSKEHTQDFINGHISELVEQISDEENLLAYVMGKINGTISENIWYLQPPPDTLSESSVWVPIIGPTEKKNGISWTRRESCALKHAFVEAGFTSALIHSAFNDRDCGSA